MYFDSQNLIWERLNNAQFLFINFLQYTKKKSPRKLFPKKESSKFIERLSSLFTAIEAWKKDQFVEKVFINIKNFINSLKTASQVLKGVDGINAFKTFLDLLNDLTLNFIQQIANYHILESENLILQQRMDELEQTIEEIEQKENETTFTAIDEDLSTLNLNLTFSSERNSFLEDMRLALTFIQSSGCKICTVYEAFELSNNSKRVVVIYEGLIDDIPPSLETIYWRNLKCFDTSESSENWDLFRSSNPEMANYLMNNYTDTNILQYFTRMSDLVALFPGAVRINGVLEPVLEVLKLSVGYCSDNIPEIENIVLSTKKSLKIWYRNGYLNKMNENIQLGNGMTIKGCGDNFGTIGCFVNSEKYKGKIGLVTCEHVVNAKNQINSLDPLASTNTQFVFPGRGSRIAKILSLYRKNEGTTLKLLDCLLKYYDDDKLKQLLNVNKENLITLKNISDYLNQNQEEFCVENEDIQCFSDNSIEVTIPDNLTLHLKGDVSVILISETELASKNKNISNKIEGLNLHSLYLPKVFASLSSRGKIDVFKKGANDESKNSGCITRPVSLKTPFNQGRFLVNKISNSLKDLNNNYKTLTTMYFIHASPDFAVGGDSGSLVYTLNDDKSKVFALGIFMGSFDSCGFLATPIDVITKDFSLLSN